MRIKITKGGIFGGKGEVPIGEEFTVKEAPAGWAGRYEVISGGDSKAAKTPVINPAPAGETKTVSEVLGLADANFMAFKSAAKKILGDATPGSKDEIIAALVDKLSDDELKLYLTGKGVTIADEPREQLIELAKAA